MPSVAGEGTVFHTMLNFENERSGYCISLSSSPHPLIVRTRELWQQKEQEPVREVHVTETPLSCIYLGTIVHFFALF